MMTKPVWLLDMLEIAVKYPLNYTIKYKKTKKTERMEDNASAPFVSYHIFKIKYYY